MDLIYADYAAATPVDERVIKKVAEVSAATFGNPSSAHGFGHAAWVELNEAKKTIAHLIKASPEELYFTSSGTESNNLAILGVAKANKTRGNHIITSNIEHPSVLNTCRALEREGFVVTYLEVDQNGQISIKELERAITKQTILVTLHYGNSEIGTLLDIPTIGKLCHEKGVYLHVDACQSVAYLAINVQQMYIDLLTFNGNKLYGPKGVAVLYVKNGVNIFPIVYGGGQQKSLRSGTENVPGIVGLAKACEIAQQERESYSKKIAELRDELEQSCQQIAGVSINISSKSRLPNHLSIRFDHRKNADLVREMDRLGVAVSAGSACSSTSIVDSHVLTAIGLTSEQAQATLRISLGKNTTQQDCDNILTAIKKSV